MSSDIPLTELSAVNELAPEESALRKYLCLRRCLLSFDEGDEPESEDEMFAWNVVFTVGVQSFVITNLSRDTQEEAVWYAEMFIKALSAVIKESPAAS